MTKRKPNQPHKVIHMRDKDPMVRFLAYSQRPSDDACWMWLGCENGKDEINGGYARFIAHGKVIMVHRWAYQQWVGPIPEGYQIDHLCRNRMCVNPKHLEGVTQRDNILRGNGYSARNAAKTHCKYGHEFSDENTKLIQGKHRRQRVCLICERNRGRGFRAPVGSSVKSLENGEKS